MVRHNEHRTVPETVPSPGLFLLPGGPPVSGATPQHPLVGMECPRMPVKLIRAPSLTISCPKALIESEHANSSFVGLGAAS